MGAGNYIPLIVTLSIIFTLGLAMNLIISPFVDLSTPQGAYFSSIVSAINDNNFFDTPIDTGIGIFGFNFYLPNINIWALLPDTFDDFLTEQLTLISYIPLNILIPMTILFIVSIIWTTVKLILP